MASAAIAEQGVGVDPARVRLIHLSLALGAFAIGTTEFASMSLLPDMAQDLGIDAPTAGHVISAYASGVVVGAPVLAVATARWSRRWLLVALMTWLAIGNALSAFAPSYHTMLAARFLSGFPHGAYFGIAMLLAASLVEPNRRTAAVANVFIGLTVATIVGVPLATWLGQALGWRSAYIVVAVLATTSAALVGLLAPRDRADKSASPLRELTALKRPQVLLTLAVGAIGFGGLFAVYTYLANTMVAVTKVAPSTVPLALVAFGVGMTAANLIVPRFADRALLPSAAGVLVWSLVALLAWPLAAPHLWSVMACMLAIGAGGALGTVMQTRLMDVAGDAQALAAALNHSAFNAANALGPLLGGLAISAGWGWTSTGPVGACLAAAGLAILAFSWWLERRDRAA